MGQSELLVRLQLLKHPSKTPPALSECYLNLVCWLVSFFLL